MIISYVHLKRYFLLFIIIIVSTVIVSSFYSIPDIDGYFLNAYISLSFFCVIGLCFLFSNAVKNSIRVFIIVLVTFCIFTQVYFNYYKTNKSNSYLTYDVAKAILCSVNKNSIIYSHTEHCFAAYYLQNVEGIRKDVVLIINYGLQYEWYLKQLNKLYPDILSRINNYNIDVSNKSVYITSDALRLIEKKVFSLPAGAKLVPDLFLYRVTYNDDYTPINFPNVKIRFNTKINDIKDIKNILYILMQRYYYELDYKRIDNANRIIRIIKEIDPKINISGRKSS